LNIQSADDDGRDILISIVNYRSAAYCIDCLASLAAERKLLPALRVVVADGASGDGSVEALEQWVAASGHSGWIEVLPLELNGGFGWAHNQVILRALQSKNRPAFIHLLNPDTVVEPGAVAELRQVFDRDPRIGCAGSQMINSQGGLQPAGFRLPCIRSEFARGAQLDGIATLLGAKGRVIDADDATATIEAVSGASFMVRADALGDVGLFDHGFFLYFEEFEWMKRFRDHGWKVAHAPNSKVCHHGGVSTKLSRDRKVLAQSARPFYWYQSQRRFMYRTLGVTRARLAGLAWFAGFALIAWPWSLLSRQARTQIVKNERRGMLRAWLAKEDFDRRPYIAFPSELINQPPAWQTRPDQ
jgi:GT2 family glycosyltransferase